MQPRPDTGVTRNAAALFVGKALVMALSLVFLHLCRPVARRLGLRAVCPDPNVFRSCF